MKKLSLVLGSLLIAATASAKEVVAQPVVVAEPVVVEEVAPVEVPKFKPSGFVQFEQKYFGDGEHEDVTGNYFRSEFKGAISMTEADTLQWRVRSYDDLNSEGSQNEKGENTETRYRWLHKFGTIGDSKVDFATRLELKQRDDYDHVELQTRFGFEKYIPDASWFETTDFTLAPKVRYTQYETSDDTAVGAGIDFMHYAVLPWGFEWDLTVYYLYNDNSADGYYNSSQYPNGSRYDKANGIDDNYTSNGNNIDVEAYIYNSQNLWTSVDGFYELNTWFEGGLDALTYRDGDGDTNNNSMYAMPELQLTANLNPSTALTLAGGAEYRNWNDDEMHSIQDFTWQPFAAVRVKTTF